MKKCICTLAILIENTFLMCYNLRGVRDMTNRNIKYKQVYETLKGGILSGRYHADRPLPSLRALVRKYGVSTITVRRAFDELERERLVSRCKGSGTFVTKAAMSRKIGLIVPGICYSEIFPPICKELSRLAQKEGYSLLLGDLTSNDPAERGRRAKVLARQYVKENVAGIIFQPLEFLKNSEEVNRDVLSIFDAANIPVVLLDCDIVASPARSKYDVVGINNGEAGRCLAQHMVDQGVRNVVFLAAPHSDYSIQNRIEGARAAVVAAKGHFRTLSIDVGDASAVKRLLARRPSPEAIICRNDHQSAHLMVTLRSLGKRIPEDVLVAGFNDVGYASILSPSLTTVHLPCEDIARQAFGFLCERIAGPELSTRECYLSAPLIARSSTNCKREVKRQRKGKANGS